MESERIVYRIDNGLTPWGIPYDIYWDVRPLASVRRALWVMQNVPDVDINDVIRVMALQKHNYERNDYKCVPEIDLLEIVLNDLPVPEIFQKDYDMLFPDKDKTIE